MQQKDMRDREERPATVVQLAAAMAALGAYHGQNTEAEHAAEAERLGGADAYRLRLANALLGIVQTEAVLADSSVSLDVDERRVAWAQQLDSAGVEDDPAKLIGFIQWQVLRAATPLREIAQHVESGPIPVAAAHAADGLQMLLSVIAASQAAIATGDVAALATQAPALREARAALENAITNTDLLLDLLASVGL
jgi:hypothetical protein